MKVLWLSNNPCAEDNPNYRKHVISVLPHLTKLDNVEVSSDEREQAIMFAKEESKAQKPSVNRKPSYTALQDKSNKRSHSPLQGSKHPVIGTENKGRGTS